MKIKRFTSVAAGTAFMIMSQMQLAAAESNASSSDTKFIKHVANANMTEIKLGKIAGDNGQKQSVKDFGSLMVSDHGKAEDQLKAIAQKINITIPSQVNAEHQKTIDHLSKLKGVEFDKAYAEAMVKDHNKVISMFEKAEGDVKDAELKNFAQETLPTLKEHLNLAEKMQSGK